MPENQLPDAYIYELPELLVPQPGNKIPVYDHTTGLTKQLDISLVLPTSPSSSYKWVSGFSYPLDAIVEHSGKWYRSLQADNLGQVPGLPGSLYWEESDVSGSGFVMYAPGVFVQDEVFVLNTLSGLIQLFRLDPAVDRPFNSTNFYKEFAEGIWGLASEDGYYALEKAAHGFAVNNVLTFKTGAWNKYTTDDKPLGLVTLVPDVNTAIVKLFGVVLKGLSGLAAGSLYYAQADGTLSTVESSAEVLIAISATEAILFSSGGSSSSGPRFRGAFDASSGALPATDLRAGDEWYVSVDGILDPGDGGGPVPALANKSVIKYLAPGLFKITT
jgi:hypothetical protein